VGDHLGRRSYLSRCGRLESTKCCVAMSVHGMFAKRDGSYYKAFPATGKLRAIIYATLELCMQLFYSMCEIAMQTT
jgi:hypothetical protein